jgi:hypothetical protein
MTSVPTWVPFRKIWSFVPVTRSSWGTPTAAQTPGAVVVVTVIARPEPLPSMAMSVSVSHAPPSHGTIATFGWPGGLVTASAASTGSTGSISTFSMRLLVSRTRIVCCVPSTRDELIVHSRGPRIRSQPVKRRHSEIARRSPPGRAGSESVCGPWDHPRCLQPSASPLAAGWCLPGGVAGRWICGDPDPRHDRDYLRSQSWASARGARSMSRPTGRGRSTRSWRRRSTAGCACRQLADVRAVGGALRCRDRVQARRGGRRDQDLDIRCGGRPTPASAISAGGSRVDLLQVHNLVAWRSHLDWMERERAAGAIGWLGAHDIPAVGVRRAGNSHALGTDPRRPSALNPIEDESAHRILPLALELGLGVIAMRPLGEGSLLRRSFPADLPRPAYGWPEALLRWCLADPRVTVAIPATTSSAHAAANAAAGGMPLDPNLRERIAASSAPAVIPPAAIDGIVRRGSVRVLRHRRGDRGGIVVYRDDRVAAFSTSVPWAATWSSLRICRRWRTSPTTSGAPGRRSPAGRAIRRSGLPCEGVNVPRRRRGGVPGGVPRPPPCLRPHDWRWVHDRQLGLVPPDAVARRARRERRHPRGPEPLRMQRPWRIWCWLA